MQLPALALIAALAATPIQVRTLDGTRQSGQLTLLESGRLTLEVDGAPVDVEASDLLELRNDAVPEPDEFLLERSSVVRFIDESQLHVQSFALKDRTVTVTSDLLGEIEAPQSEIRSVRLAEMDSAVRSAWDDLHDRESKADLLVVRKTDALDFVGGVVAGADAGAVQVLVKSREVSVPVDRVFGLIFAQTTPQGREPACETRLASGDRLVLKRIAIREDRLEGTLQSGAAVTLPMAQVQVIDFGLGRVRYLADLPESAEYKPVGLITSKDVLQVRKNMNSIGGSFVVGKKSYDRGLWVHSGTTLKYRINRDYRRLQATIGVDRSSSGCARVNPQIRATISGDGAPLFEGRFGWDGEPETLDLDVAGVRDVVNRVEPAQPDTIGACEHLVLAEARVIK